MYVTGMISDSQVKLRDFSLYNDYDLPRFWFDELSPSCSPFKGPTRVLAPFVGFSGFSEGSIGPPLTHPGPPHPLPSLGALLGTPHCPPNSRVASQTLRNTANFATQLSLYTKRAVRAAPPVDEPLHQTFERRSRPDSFVVGPRCRPRRRPRAAASPRPQGFVASIENVDHVRFAERVGHRGGRKHEGGHEQGDGFREDRAGHPLRGGLEGRRERRAKRGELHGGRGGRILPEDDVPAGRMGSVDRLTLRLYRNYAYELPRTIFRELPGSP